jgi:hypothetical protein
MKGLLKWVGSVSIIILMVQIISCKDDEIPITGIAFELADQEVTESDGSPESFHPEIDGDGRVIQVKLAFDRELAGDAVITFSLAGTALQEETDDELNDFEIQATGDMMSISEEEITILKGATEASFNILIFEDLSFEYDEDVLNDDDVSFETIVITLGSVISGPVKLGEQFEHTVKILEDDAVAFLQWEAQDMEPDDAEVDMDILIWLNGAIVWGGVQPGPNFEGINVPAGLGEGEFGVSYTYYSGNSDDLNFAGILFNTAGSLNGDRYTYPDDDPLIFEGNYKLANINPWDSETGTNPLIAQTMVKSGIDYSEISEIEPFTSGSRVGDQVPFKLDPSVLKKIASQSKVNWREGLIRRK